MATAPHKVRIGGGEWRSRLLTVTDLPGLRPTPDRVRQTLFNWLGQDLQGLHCLDLFAGTGVLGFESLSRGAASAAMVEQAAPAYQALLANKALLKASTAQLYRQDAWQFLAANQQRFDLIYLDPPYHQGWLDKLLPVLAPHLAEHGLVYAEAEHALVDGHGWQVTKHGRAGNVHYHLLSLQDSVHA